ncbi:oligosaccharide flippase family protein [uncultured Roseivirga sp.]|uniref:oligosaccharide flippase family protein n=1 Tax=uncultured Roseivirga sp. TaxID=543088 RepID=UPI0030D92730|tara:strand:- start:438 stop:1880 length:1443 start_codon:yes stop_codon:yes gene_type:complete
MLKSFLKDGLYYSIPSFLSKGIGFLLLPLLTKVLSPSDYGSVDLFAAFVGLVNLTIALEVSQGVARYYGGEESETVKQEIFSSAFWFTILCYTLFSLIMLASSQWVSYHILGSKGLVLEFRIGILSMWFGGIYYLVQNQFRWELRSKEFMWTSVSVVLATFLLSYLLTYRAKLGISGVFMAQAGGSAVGLFLGLYWLKSSLVFSLNKIVLLKMLKFSTPLVFSGIAIFISTYVDRVMISRLMSVSEVGLYGVGFRIASVVGLVLAGFQGAVTPLVYANHMKKDTPNNIARIFKLFIFIALSAYLTVGVFVDDFIILFTTEEYTGAAVVVIFIFPALLISQMYIFTPGIVIAKKTKYFFYINIFGAVLNTILNYFLIQELGILGASLATLLTAILVFGIYAFFNHYFYPIPFEWGSLILAFLISLSVVFAIGTDALVLEGILPKSGALILTLIIITLLLLGSKDISNIKEWVNANSKRFKF